MKKIVGMLVLASVVAMVVGSVSAEEAKVEVAPYTFDDAPGLAPSYIVTGYNNSASVIRIMGITGILPRTVELVSVVPCQSGFMVTQKTSGYFSGYRAIILDLNGKKFKEYVAKVVGRRDTNFEVKSEITAINFCFEPVR
jgi:hypothetical protein